jgi:dolichol-phosphate hexosyltransferase
MSIVDHVTGPSSGYVPGGFASDELALMPESIVARPRTTTRKDSLTILLPALNEEHGLTRVLDLMPHTTFENTGCDVSIWVVDGASADATCEIARAKGARVFTQTGRGKGNGVRQAIDQLLLETSKSRTGYDRSSVVMLDADGSYLPEDILRFLDAMREGHDVVLGSRFLGEIDSGAMSNLNRLGNRVLSVIASTLFGVGVTDVCTGMWGFTRDFLASGKLNAEGFDLEASIFANAARSNAKIAQIPIRYMPRIGEPKLIPLRTGLIIAWRLLCERIKSKSVGRARKRARGAEVRP